MISKIAGVLGFAGLVVTVLTVPSKETFFEIFSSVDLSVASLAISVLSCVYIYNKLSKK